MASKNTGNENGANYSPPRGLKDIFASESKTSEFETYLRAIDEENEDLVMVTRLRFVLQCRKLNGCIQSLDNANSSQNDKKPTEIQVIT